MNNIALEGYNEDILQTHVVNYVRCNYPDAFVCHIPNGHLTENARRKCKALGIKVGIPDLFIATKKVSFFLELKTKVGILRETQIETIEEIRTKTRLQVHVAYGFGQAKILIDSVMNQATTKYMESIRGIRKSLLKLKYLSNELHERTGNEANSSQ